MTRIKSRIGSFIVTIAMLAFVLPTSIVSAKPKQEKMLTDALLKTNKAKSMESDGKLSVNLKAEGLSKEDQQQYTGVTKILNNLQVVFNAKQSQKGNGKELKQYIKTTAKVSGIPFTGELWNAKKLKGNKTEANTIVKSPQLFKMILPTEYTYKYMVLNSKQTKEKEMSKMKMQGNLNSMHKIISGNKELHNLILTINEKYSSQLNLNSYITNDGNVYKVKINDAEFKDIIRKVVNLTSKDKEVQNLIKNYVLTEMNNSGASNTEIKSTEAQMEGMFTKLESQEFIDEFMDKLQDIKMLGDKGIEITYTIDKNGYVINTKGQIELFADIAKLQNAFGKSSNDTMHSGTSTANIHFEVNNKNFDKKMNIKLPKLTSENSFNHSELCDNLQPVKISTKIKTLIKHNLMAKLNIS